MSLPIIPGYTGPPRDDTLAALWKEPEAVPPGLWPGEILHSVDPEPTGWVTVCEHFYTEDLHGGRGTVLVRVGDGGSALEDTAWIGHDLGEVSVWDAGEFDGGLSKEEPGLYVEFFAQARQPSGASLPIIELHHSFLWYWDAFPIQDGWQYLNRAGREQDLVRWQRSSDRWQIEVRALEFRQYLFASGRDAVMQIDFVPKIEGAPFERIDTTFSNGWAHFDFHTSYERSMGKRPGYSRILGQYLILGNRTARVPRWEERDQDHRFPGSSDLSGVG